MDLELQPWPSNVSGEGIATKCKEMYILAFVVVLNLSFSSCHGEEPGMVAPSSKTVPSVLNIS